MRVLFTALLISFASNLIYAQKHVGELTKSEFNLSEDKFNFFTFMFETKKQFYDFLEIKPGETIAEVGADKGINLGILSMFYDNLTLYAQDINAKRLTQKNLNKTISYYTKRRHTPQTNTFKWAIGTINSTKLPEQTFDKIFIIDAFHDFDKKDEMIDDIATKLKPDGKIILLDGFSFVGDTQICPDAGKHVLTTVDVEISRFEKHGFYLTKMRSPNCNGAHYGNGLVFERNKNKSDEFYKLKNAVDVFVNNAFRLKQKEMASDSVAVERTIDSLLQKIKEINSVYPEFEVWVKDLGLKHLRKKENQAAINILQANKKLFPYSIHAYYWLSIAYKENNQLELAKKYMMTYNDLRIGKISFQKPTYPN